MTMRRTFWQRTGGAMLSALLLVSTGASAEEQGEPTTITHGLSAFGDLKYPLNFSHFEYSNPQAPKGGTLSLTGIIGRTTYDSLNAYILKGDGAEGIILLPVDGLSLIFDTLMVRAGDAPDALYGLVAREAEIPADKSWIIFRLREEAQFHDGTPLSAEDISFSFTLLMEKGHPQYRQALADVEEVEILGPHEIKFIFAQGAETRDLPLAVAELPIFSKAYYTVHAFDESTMEPPLGSGPYKIGNLEQGRFIEYTRVTDYWAKDLPVNRGRWNFDTIRYDYFRDRTIAFQAFTGHEYDLREEFTSRVWATQYDFPAVMDGRVKRSLIKDETPSGFQGYYYNMRRPQFADARVREALGLAFDFDWTNKNLFYGAYQRTTSFFQGASELMATGAPTGLELAALEPYRAGLPPALFTRAYTPPQSDGSGRIRSSLQQARQLFAQAGWRAEEGKLVDENGAPFKIEFLIFSPSSERIIAAYIKNLTLLGIDAEIRLVDPSQYIRRMEEFDFDVITARYTQSNTPGLGLRSFFSTAAGKIPGTQNLAGIKDPVVDALIEAVVAASSRDELNARVRALDRVLREGHYWVPQWTSGKFHLAFWDKFAWPEIKPKYQRGIIDTWWVKDVNAPQNTGDEEQE